MDAISRLYRLGWILLVPIADSSSENGLSFKKPHATETEKKGPWLVVEPTQFEKYDRQNGFIFPNFRGENKKYLKPPPRSTWVLTIPKIQAHIECHFELLRLVPFQKSWA